MNIDSFVPPTTHYVCNYVCIYCANVWIEFILFNKFPFHQLYMIEYYNHNNV